jgi:cell division protein FtsB
MADTSRIGARSNSRAKKSGWKSKLKMFLITTGAVFLIISFFWGEYGLVRMWFLSNKIKNLKKDITLLKVQRNDYLWETNKMKNDPAYIQRYAIQTYGYAKPDHKIIQFVPADSSSIFKMKKTSGAAKLIG